MERDIGQTLENDSSSLENREHLVNLLLSRYEDELERKTRLESKASGYYTVIGISFAGMVGIIPFWIGEFLKYPNRYDLITLFNFCIFILVSFYFILCSFGIWKLFSTYRPRSLRRFSVPEMWDYPAYELSRMDYLESIYRTLKAHTEENEEANGQIVREIELINAIVVAMMAISILIIMALLAVKLSIRIGVIYVGQ